MGLKETKQCIGDIPYDRGLLLDIRADNGNLFVAHNDLSSFGYPSTYAPNFRKNNVDYFVSYHNFQAFSIRNH
jgi:hypothetical protein